MNHTCAHCINLVCLLLQEQRKQERLAEREARDLAREKAQEKREKQAKKDAKEAKKKAKEDQKKEENRAKVHFHTCHVPLCIYTRLLIFIISLKMYCSMPAFPMVPICILRKWRSPGRSGWLAGLNLMPVDQTTAVKSGTTPHPACTARTRKPPSGTCPRWTRSVGAVGSVETRTAVAAVTRGEGKYQGTGGTAGMRWIEETGQSLPEGGLTSQRGSGPFPRAIRSLPGTRGHAEAHQAAAAAAAVAAARTRTAAGHLPPHLQEAAAAAAAAAAEATLRTGVGGRLRHPLSPPHNPSPLPQRPPLARCFHRHLVPLWTGMTGNRGMDAMWAGVRIRSLPDVIALSLPRGLVMTALIPPRGRVMIAPSLPRGRVMTALIPPRGLVMTARSVLLPAMKDQTTAMWRGIDEATGAGEAGMMGRGTEREIAGAPQAGRWLTSDGPGDATIRILTDIDVVPRRPAAAAGPAAGLRPAAADPPPRRTANPQGTAGTVGGNRLLVL